MIFVLFDKYIINPISILKLTTLQIYRLIKVIKYIVLLIIAWSHRPWLICHTMTSLTLPCYLLITCLSRISSDSDKCITAYLYPCSTNPHLTLVSFQLTPTDCCTLGYYNRPNESNLFLHVYNEIWLQ